MKILLIGEYSRLHNSLKEGLIKLGHEVVILGFSDGFKDFPVDYKLEKKWDLGWKRKIKVGIYKAFGFDISSHLTFKQFQKNQSQFTDFDVVQLINESTFQCVPAYEQKILKFLFKNNAKVFLLSCGDDCGNVKYNFEHPKVKSVVQPYLMGKISNRDFLGVLKFTQPDYKKLHDFIYKHIKGVIASDLDYHTPLLHQPKYLGLIPNPINTDKITFTPLEVPAKIVIFLGINNANYYKKGSDYFEEALSVIASKYPEKTQIIITRSIPYAEYIKAYDSAHIVLDQTFSLDQGYNALEAMAKGKVVFTGAEKEFTEYYQLAEKVNINATADVKQLINALSNLIENPEQIVGIGKNARAFIEKEHNYVKIAEQYLRKWQ